MFQDINNRQGTQNRLIDDHAYEQKRLLEQEYQKQISYLEGSRNQFINASRPYELKGDNDQIDQLLVQCSALKCELAALQSSERTIRFIQFMTEEQIAQKKRNERNTERVDDSKFRNKTGGDYDNYTGNNPSAHGSSSTKMTSVAPNQTK
jgi:ERCC4-type nuclease